MIEAASSRNRKAIVSLTRSRGMSGSREPDFRIAGPIVRFEDAGNVYAMRELAVAFTPGRRRNPA